MVMSDYARWAWYGGNASGVSNAAAIDGAGGQRVGGGGAPVPDGLLEALLATPPIRPRAVATARARLERHEIPPPERELASLLVDLLVAGRR